MKEQQEKEIELSLKYFDEKVLFLIMNVQILSNRYQRYEYKQMLKRNLLKIFDEMYDK